MTWPHVRRAQPRHQGSDVPGFDELLDRGALEEDLGDDVLTRDVVLGGLRVDLPVDERGADVAGVDAVAGDAVFRALQRGDLGKPFEPVLRGDVRGFVGGGAKPVDARHVDDPPPAPRVHRREAPPDEQEGCGDHQRLDPRELRGREVFERRDVLDPGVVDQDVDLGRERVDGPGVGEVDGVRPPPTSVAAASAFSASTSTTCTLAPAAARARTQARPIPPAPPVTRAVRPSRSLVMDGNGKRATGDEPCARNPQPGKIQWSPQL